MKRIDWPIEPNELPPQRTYPTQGEPGDEIRYCQECGRPWHRGEMATVNIPGEGPKLLGWCCGIKYEG